MQAKKLRRDCDSGCCGFEPRFSPHFLLGFQPNTQLKKKSKSPFPCTFPCTLFGEVLWLTFRKLIDLFSYFIVIKIYPYFYSLLLDVDTPSAVPARTLSESDPSRTQPLVNILVIYCLLYKKQTINCQSPRVTTVNNR